MTADDKIEAFEDLIADATSALEDVVAVLKERGQDDAITQALADVVGALEKRSAVDFGPIAEAIRSLRDLPPPVVQVTVKPAEVIVQRSALDDGATIELRMPAPAGGRDKVMLIRKLPTTTIK